MSSRYTDTGLHTHLSVLLHESSTTPTSTTSFITACATRRIQSWFRTRLYKEWKSYTHLTAPNQSINPCDFFTFQPIQEIPYYRRFFLFDESDDGESAVTATDALETTQPVTRTYVFGFDMDSFYQLLQHTTHPQEEEEYFLQPLLQPHFNPYTRNPITEKQLYRFYRTLFLHRILFPFFPYRVKQSMTCLQLFDTNQSLFRHYFPLSYDLRIKVLMEEIADLEPQWEVVQGIRWWKEITSNPSKSRMFYRVLSIILRSNTRPLFYFYRFPQRATFSDAPLLCLDICESVLFGMGFTLEERQINATLVLTALSVVSKDIRTVFPWLYKNYW